MDNREPPYAVSAFEQHDKVDMVMTTELEVGDIQFENITIERKTYSDFYQSMLSGHLDDQIGRMLEKCKYPLLMVHQHTSDYQLKRDDHIKIHKHIKNLNLILPVYTYKNISNMVKGIIEFIDNYSNGRYFGKLKRPIPHIDSPNKIISFYASMPGVGLERARRLAIKYPRPWDLFAAINDTAVYNREKWKTKQQWRLIRFDEGLIGISNGLVNKISSFILDGTLEVNE